MVEAWETQGGVRQSASWQAGDVQKLLLSLSRRGLDLGAPVSAVAVPRASARKVSDDPPLYDFECWLEVPAWRRARIEKVSYRFNHPTFVKKVQESADAEDDHRVRYRGWGALRLVILTIHLKDGDPVQLAFDMAEAIGAVPGVGAKASKVPVKSRRKVPVKGGESP